MELGSTILSATFPLSGSVHCGRGSGAYGQVAKLTAFDGNNPLHYQVATKDRHRETRLGKLGLG